MSLSILQISATHLGAEPTAPISPGVYPWHRASCLVESIRDWIADVAVPIDFIVHTGDLVHRGHTPHDQGDSTRKGIDLFQSLAKPIHWVIGNHDHRSALKRNLSDTPGTPLTFEQDRWAYHFQVRGERVAILDARASLDYDPQGEISQEQLDNLQSLLDATTEPISLFLHYPPIQLRCDWIDRTMLIRNGQTLHNLLCSFKHRIRGVFFGHVHRPTFTLRDGILYASCGSTTMHFPNWPGSMSAVISDDPIAFAQYIQLGDDGVFVKPQWLTLPARGTTE